MGRLENKIVLVTGAGGGIGRAICAHILSEGGSVAAADIDLDAARAGVGEEHIAAGRATAIECDAGDPASVRATIDGTIAALGGLTSIFTVAGGSTDRDGPVISAPEEEFWRVVRLDLFGTFLACKYGIPKLIQNGGGAVVTMTSMAALMAVPNRDCYTAAKGGVAAMTRSIAAGHAQSGVRVNAIAPGITATPRVLAQQRSSPQMSALTERHLLGAVEPADVAALGAFLISDEATRITGQVLSVDSGVTIH
ncbi:SDR family oxidoreductase [Nocardia sp. CA2R105]|uniref:SDR family NAD(P)-dependent oxidoreductase n=1 Tax=Nocardia coffeae TaxID=2873381 RepID=UPI001CA6BB69|nr:SDR family oxidoreductase [Nocardia coffeae]MBY8858688.1 SDR family oxidoreductase [Nocardia coffeae]